MDIKILGSSHISGKYARHIREIILIEEPEIVAVELDAARLFSLFSNEKPRYSIRDIGKIGLFGFLFGAIGSKIQTSLGKQIGFEPGIDMKTAVIAAKETKAKIILIDQPIEITLRKLSKIRFWEKLKLLFFIVFSPFSKKNRALSKKIDLQNVPEEEVIEEIISDLKKKVPNFYQVLVEDRNKILAKNLIEIGKRFKGERSIAVIGAGHKKEVERLIKQFE